MRPRAGRPPHWPAALLWLATAACTDRAGPPRAGEVPFAFADVTADAGIRFVHATGARGLRQLPETMGGGAAWLDYDGDGDFDLLLLQSGELPDHASDPAQTNALYRNDGGTFVDVTASGGDVARTGYAQGVAAADFDGDGDPDLYVTCFGANHLLRNDGGVFCDVSAAAGVADPGWGSACAFFDMDGDGDLDLYVVNYLDYRLEDVARLTPGGKGYAGYPHPDRYRAGADVLFRNEGDGTFTDVTRAAGILDVDGKGLGVLPCDLDGDGDLDLYVANDSTPNFLFRNDGHGRFTDVTAASNAGYDRDGRTQAGMGIAAGDIDRDGLLDLFVTNLDLETNTMYRNLGGLAFEDVTGLRGLARPSVGLVGFGAGFLDADLDGDLDLFVGNGHIIDNIAELQPGTRITHAQRCLFFENDGRGFFRELEGRLAPALAAPRVARAAAFADYDDDGDLDVALAVNGGPAVLLRNDGARAGHFLQVRVLDAHGADALGARVVLRIGGVPQVLCIAPSSSYYASNDPRAFFGAREAVADELRVHWPSGNEARFDSVSMDRRLVVRPDGTIEVLEDAAARGR